MVTLLEHLRKSHPGLAYFIIGTSLAVVVIGLVLFVYFKVQERAQREVRRSERRDQRRRGKRQKR